jgi:hypothetical protein
MRKALGAGGAAVVVAGALTAGGAFAADSTGYSDYVTDGRITICHATGSADNPYKVLTVSADQVSGHLGRGDDVVPPVLEGDPGLNFFDALRNPDWYPGASVTPQSCNPVPGTGALVPGPFKVLIYEYHPEVLSYRNNDADGEPGGPTHRDLHLAHAREAKAAGDLVNIGATGPGGALIVFRGSVPNEVIEEYALTDPYHTPNSPDPDLIQDYEIKPWTVVG